MKFKFKIPDGIYLGCSEDAESDEIIWVKDNSLIDYFVKIFHVLFTDKYEDQYEEPRELTPEEKKRNGMFVSFDRVMENSFDEAVKPQSFEAMFGKNKHNKQTEEFDGITELVFDKRSTLDFEIKPDTKIILHNNDEKESFIITRRLI